MKPQISIKCAESELLLQHKEKSSSMVILNCDGLSQFYFGGLLTFVRKFGIDDNTIIIIVRTCEYVKRGIANFYQLNCVDDAKEK